MEGVDELNALFSERFTAAVDEWLSMNRKSDGSQYSRLDLASLLNEHCGYSKSCLYRWIEGNGMPTLPNLLCTAQFFKKDLSYFIEQNWTFVQVKGLVGEANSFRFDTNLIGRKQPGQLRFWLTPEDLPEMGAKKGDRIIIEVTKKFIKDGFYLLEGFTGAKGEIRRINKNSRGKVEIYSVGSKNTQANKEVVLLKNLSILGIIILKLESI